jgi:predicted methyltransferase
MKNASIIVLGLLLVMTGLTAGAASLAPDSPRVGTNEAVANAIAHPDRPSQDREQDSHRKPAEILDFVGVGRDMHVMDVFSAGGYYTELLARVVGPEGRVIAYNNPPYARFAEKGIAARYAGDRLPNVRQVTSTIEDLDLEPASLEAAIFIMSYHDLYWRPADGSWPPTDPALLLGKLHAALKPGGVIVVQDHVATAGGDTAEVVDKLHRIDPAVVKADFAKAGFTLDGESDVLAHPDDAHTIMVFDEAIRGKTDQFLFRFRKPATE